MSLEYFTSHSHVSPVIATSVGFDSIATFSSIITGSFRFNSIQPNHLLSSSLGRLLQAQAQFEHRYGTLCHLLLCTFFTAAMNQGGRGRPRDLDGGSSRCEFMPRGKLRGDCITIAELLIHDLLRSSFLIITFHPTSFSAAYRTPPSSRSNSRSPSISPSMSPSSPSRGAMGVLGYKARQSKKSYHPSSGLSQLARSLPSLDQSASAKTGSQATPRKKATTTRRYIPREDSLELSDVFIGKNIHVEDSNKSANTEGTSPDSWLGSTESFPTSSPSSSSVGRWMGSNDSSEDTLSSPTDESEHSKTLSKSSTNSESSNSSGDATTCASNLSNIAKAGRKVASKSNTVFAGDDFFEMCQGAPIASDIDETHLLEYLGSSTTSATAQSTLHSTLAMHSKNNEAAVRLTKDIDAFIDTVQAAGANRNMDESSRFLSDTNLASKYQMNQQEIEQLHRATAERKREAVRYKQMADLRSSYRSVSMPGRSSPKPAKTSRRGSTGAIVSAKDEARERRSQLVRSGRGMKDLPSMVSSQSTGGILKQKHQRRYSTEASSSCGSSMDVSIGSDSFHDSSSTFLSQDSTTSSRSTSSFSVKFKKPTIITYEKEQDYRTPYDSDGRRRRPSKPYTANATDLNDAIQNEVVARRLASATAGRRNAGRRNSMPAGHMAESLPTSTMLPSTKSAGMPRRSTTDMISSMEQRLRRLSNESSDDEEYPLRNRGDQVSLNYSSNVSRRLSGDAVNSFYQCPDDNALDATMHGVGERGAAATFSFPEGPRSSPRSSPRSHRVVTKPPSRMEMAMKAMGFGKGR